MAVAFDVASHGGNTTGTSYSWSHTCTGAGMLLIVFVHLQDNSVTVTGITYNGVALTFGDAIQGSSFTPGRLEIWYLIAPATGANTVVVTKSLSSPDSSAIAASFTGVHQTTPLGTIVKAEDGSSPGSLSVASAVGDMVVGAIANDVPSTFTPDGTQTDRDSFASGLSGIECCTEAGASPTVSMDWTWVSSTADTAYIAVSVKAQPAPTTLTPSPLAIPIALPAPIVNYRLMPSPLAIPISIPTPVAFLNMVTPSPLAIPISLPAPNLVTVQLTPSPLQIPIGFPTPLLIAVRILTPSPLAIPISIPTPGGSISTPLRHRQRAVITDPDGTVVGQMIG